MQDNEKEVLLFCKVPKTRSQIQSHVKMKNRDYFRKSILNPLVKSGNWY
jgi:ATP-dependent DNA helicase RecG